MDQDVWIDCIGSEDTDFWDELERQEDYEANRE